MKKKVLLAIIVLVVFIVFLSTCGNKKENNNLSEEELEVTPVFSGKELFSNQELDQGFDGIDSEYDISTLDSKDLTISKEGVYKLKGSANDISILVDLKADEEVQLVLDGINITNKDKPCLVVTNGNKVFVTTTDSENSFAVTDNFASSKKADYDATVFSQKDIVFNGKGSLSIKSTKNGITGRDDVKITGGTYNIESNETCIRADNSVRIADGLINLKSGVDGIHVENEYGDALGYVYIKNGTLSILSSNYGIYASSVLEMNKGNIKVNSLNGIGGTFVQINGGDLSISAQEDGISAYDKSDSYEPAIEINGGKVSINMSEIDSNAIHSVGDITLNDGTVEVLGPTKIKYDGKAKTRKNVLTINGSKTNKI